MSEEQKDKDAYYAVRKAHDLLWQRVGNGEDSNIKQLMIEMENFINKYHNLRDNQ